MKYTTPLVNLAILETLKSSDHRDEIDLFIPYIAITINNLNEVPFTGNDLKDQLLNDFGINAPSAAIDILLARAKKRGLVKLENHSYFPINDNLSAWSDQYSTKSGDIEESLDLVSEEFIEFTQQKYGKTITQDDAISLIYNFLRENISESALLTTKDKTLAIEQIKNSKHLTASFIAHVHKNKKNLWPSFEMITRAVMLAGYLTYADQISTRNKYNNVSVFLDTPIILGLLGYSGESKSRTLLELLDMLVKHGVDVAIFAETQREIERILSAWSQDLASRCYDRFNPKTLELLNHQGIDSAAIETKIILLEQDIENLEIRIQKGFKLNPRFNCDVAALEAKIKEEFHGKWVDPRHDADALSKIHNSRQGQLPRSLNDNFCIFITPNSALAEISKDFFQITGRSIPYVASDKWLTTMFWFKHPEIFKGLPEKILVTCAYGTMFAENGLWKKFSDRLDSLRKHRRITEDDFILVRYDSDLLLKVHEISVDKGMNYSDDDIFDVVASVKEKILSEKERHIQEIQAEKSGIEEKYIDFLTKANKAISFVSSCIGWLAFTLIVSAILIISYLSIPKEVISIGFNPYFKNGAIYSTLFLLTYLVDLSGKIFNLTIHDIRIKVHEKVKGWLSKKIVG